MSESMSRCSSVSSISLLEVKVESRLVLQAFLNRTLSIPFKERPGRIGGAYKDHNKYKATVKPEPKGKVKDGLDSGAEGQSSADERKTGFKDLLKQIPRRNTPRSLGKDGKGSLEKGSKLKPPQVKDLSEEVVFSPSSTSEDDENEKKPNKRPSNRKIKRRISKFFKLKIEKDKEKEDKEKEKEAQGSKPQRPSRLDFSKKSDGLPELVSPNHPPEFYNEVAQKLEKIAQRSASTKKTSPTAPHTSSDVYDKELVVQQLVEVLSVEADSINNKIETDPFLRASLSRLSYASFARVLDTISSTQVLQTPTLLPAASPTLQRMAVSMEVSRRIVTATGTQRMQVHAECYMETFAPWVKRHGGWENVAEMKDAVEYD